MAIQQGGILLFSEDPKVIGELLTIGRELGEQAGMGVTVVASGEDAGERAEEARARGADGVLLVHAEAPVQNGVEVDAEVLREAIRTATPKVILLGATSVGLELAARVAQEIGVPCASECMSLRIDADGGLEVERRVYGGRFVVRQVISGTPKIATVQPKRFAMAEQINNDSSCDVTEITVKIGTPRVHLVSVSERARSEVDITKADVIIAAGRGIKRIEDLEMMEKLANLLEGVVAGSRPLTGDVDWLPVDRRIGLSGQTVKPNLYIACGISGQIEHIVGIKDSRTVVAINNDPEAPIHMESDYSITGDLYEIVPALIAACERTRTQ